MESSLWLGEVEEQRGMARMGIYHATMSKRARDFRLAERPFHRRIVGKCPTPTAKRIRPAEPRHTESATIESEATGAKDGPDLSRLQSLVLCTAYY